MLYYLYLKILKTKGVVVVRQLDWRVPWYIKNARSTAEIEFFVAARVRDLLKNGYVEMARIWAIMLIFLERCPRNLDWFYSLNPRFFMVVMRFLVGYKISEVEVKKAFGAHYMSLQRAEYFYGYN